MLKVVFKSLVILCALAILVGLGGAYFGHKALNEQYFVDEQRVTVTSGQHFGAVAIDLYDKKIIHVPTELLKLYARFKGLASKVKAGEYLISGNLSAKQVLEHLVEGETVSYRVTLIEGKTFNDWLEVLWQEPKLKPTLKVLKEKYEDDQGFNQAVIKMFGISEAVPEGWFYPDTYEFEQGYSDVDLLKRAHNKMKQVLADAWKGRAEDLPLTNAYQALTLASIIEKETGVAYERPEIAGVFIRRLKKNMRLETDPTVIYGLGAKFDGNLTRKHLRQKTPYNTYRIKGLPPSPIAMPSGAAIEAAVHPAPGNALFFVAKGDGSHAFSANLKQHNKAVKKYQLSRRKDYQSSPSVR